MRGKTDTTGVSEGFSILPTGTYDFEIMEKMDKTTANGDPMVVIKLVVVHGEHQDKWVYDNIVIPEIGSSAIKILGRSKHFLHCIGEPFEGKIEWDSDNWFCKKVRAKIGHEEPNQYHKYPKAVVAEYVLVEETTKKDLPEVQLNNGEMTPEEEASMPAAGEIDDIKF